MSYNAYFTSVFPKDNGELRSTKYLVDKKVDVAERVRQFASWSRQARADIFALQETIYLEEDRRDTTARGIGAYFSEVTGQQWHCVADDFGRVVLSRHPIRWSGRVKNARGMAALIDLPEAISETDMLLINIHFLSGEKHIRHRKSQASNLVKFVQAVRAGAHEAIPKDIPMVICGDFNSDAEDVPHNIVAKQDPAATDGDGLPVQFVNPRPVELTSKREQTFGRITWSGSVGDSDYTGPHLTLDHILVQKGFMAVHQAFVFNSLITSKDDLRRYGVEREAVLLARQGQVEELDHLPVFVDLK